MPRACCNARAGNAICSTASGATRSSSRLRWMRRSRHRMRLSEYLGVDLGIITLAATSDGEFLNHSAGPKHAHVNQVRARYQSLPAEAPEEGDQERQTAAHGSGAEREKRFCRDVNHCLSKAIVQTAKGTSARDCAGRPDRASESAQGKRLGNATGECCTVGRSSNSAPSSPTRRRWLGCRVVYVNPAYTSQTCSQLRALREGESSCSIAVPLQCRVGSPPMPT